MRTLLSFAAVLSSIGICGCGDGGGADAKPTDALRNMTESMKTGDRQAFLDSWRAEGDLEDVLALLFETIEASLALKAEVEKVHGPEGWTKMESRGGMEAAMSFEAIGEKIGSAHCKVEGDTATCTFPGDPQPLPLVRTGGRWRIDAEALFPPGPVREEMRATLTAMRSAVGRVRSEVGKPGATPESLGDLLKAEVEEAGKR